jgi:hypothetical protein
LSRFLFLRFLESKAKVMESHIRCFSLIALRPFEELGFYVFGEGFEEELRVLLADNPFKLLADSR